MPEESYADYFNKTQRLPVNHNWPHVFDIKIKRGYNIYNFTEQRYLMKNSVIRYVPNQKDDAQIAVDKSGSIYSDYFHYWNLSRISGNTQNWRFHFKILARINTGFFSKRYSSGDTYNLTLFVINSTAKLYLNIYVRNPESNKLASSSYPIKTSYESLSNSQYMYSTKESLSVSSTSHSLGNLNMFLLVL